MSDLIDVNDIDRLIEFMHEEVVDAYDERASWFNATGIALRNQADALEANAATIERLTAENRKLRDMIEENMSVRDEFQDWDDYEPLPVSGKQALAPTEDMSDLTGDTTHCGTEGKDNG